MLKQECQIETIKAQCRALSSKGFAVSFAQSMCGVDVTLFHKQRRYYFSDHDLDVIISQLCTFHSGLNADESHVKDFINLMGVKHGKVQCWG